MIHPKIVMVGGGSYAWTPAMISDLLHKPSLSSAHLVPVDPDPKPLERCEQFAYFAAKKRGLDTMQHDLADPEKYGNFQTVDSLVEPGGWFKSLRNVPVFHTVCNDS